MFEHNCRVYETGARCALKVQKKTNKKPKTKTTKNTNCRVSRFLKRRRNWTENVFVCTPKFIHIVTRWHQMSTWSHASTNATSFFSHDYPPRPSHENSKMFHLRLMCMKIFFLKMFNKLERIYMSFLFYRLRLIFETLLNDDTHLKVWSINIVWSFLSWQCRKTHSWQLYWYHFLIPILRKIDW